MTFDLNQSVNVLLPVVHAHQAVGIPTADAREDFTRQLDIKAIKASEQYQNYVCIVYDAKPGIEGEVIDKYFKRGVIAKVAITTSPNVSLTRAKFDVIMRCDILGFEQKLPFQIASVETVPTIVDKPDECLACLSLLKKESVEPSPINEVQVVKQKITLIANKEISMNEIADGIADTVSAGFVERYKYLQETNVFNILSYCLTDLRKRKFFNELEQRIDENVRKNMTEAQREYYLREKMRAIQEELGDKAKKEEDIEVLRTKLNNLNLPEATLKKALSELNRYATMGTNVPESGIIKTYLDFIISLPWNKQGTDTNDISLAKQILDEDHYGLEKVKERILEYLAVKILTNENPQTILCLVGPPGVGKTSLAKSVARALNKKFVKQSLGGVKDESEIRGHRRTYLGALPGRILQALSKAKVNNPVFLLDEIDKMSSDYKGDPTSAMLEVLDSEQNKFFSDNYLEEPYDLSKCFFIATANYLQNIPAPLRDRLEIVQLSSYTEYEKFEIAKHHLIDKQLKLNGLAKDKFTLTDQAIYKMIQEYTREAGVRELERLIGTLIRKAIKEVLMDKVESVTVDVDNLTKYLGKVKFENNANTGKDYVGVATGLAYTEFGGDTLQIEVAHYKGKGQIILTGKLGDVMKESAEAALSYVKMNAVKFNIDETLFATNDIHIHVPEGATPKDGPSAGITIATAIVSSFTNTPVNHLVGMTGEITLRGRVLAIGGLREKSIAAHRSGLKVILIPMENKRDIEDIPASVCASIEIIPVETAEQAIEYALKQLNN